ncbi:mRNA turnover protein 4 [Paragonimus westermani]|uniref:Ribosome assembly factor mrt4 n=1 Tax=Paragonimus westermani TaxID=34504 RepID=A0A5J4NNK2_9TREM|nr:mRNA turnover protein 4 [Paragonimus westermani]
MPLSRRDRKIDLTKVGKKASKKKEQFDKIQRYLNTFSRVYVIKFYNPRNQKIAELRHHLTNAHIVFGKNKVTMLALNKQSNKSRPMLGKISSYIKGNCALLLTNLSSLELRKNFDSFRSSEYARAGNLASQSVTLVAGPLPKFTHTMEPYLRQIGLPVKLIRGVIHLEKDFVVCKKEDALTPDQCRILKLFEIQLSEFRVGIVASWSEEDGIQALEEEDGQQMITSLPPAVRVTCQKLDDGQLYFIPEPIEENDTDETMDQV